MLRRAEPGAVALGQRIGGQPVGDHAEQHGEGDDGDGVAGRRLAQRPPAQAARTRPTPGRGDRTSPRSAMVARPSPAPGQGDRHRQPSGSRVRLSTAYSTICQVRLSSAGATATAPNTSQTSRDTRAPVSSTNGTSGSPRRPLAAEREAADERGDEAVAVQRHRGGVGSTPPGPAPPRRQSPRRPSRGGGAALTSQPPAPPTATPTSTPSASSATRGGRAVPAPRLGRRPRPPCATNTNGVAIPSLRPLSTLISRRILAGTAGLTIMPAPSAASVGASAAPTSSASQIPALPSRANASSVPRPIVSGSASAEQPQVQARIRPQLAQPDPRRIREQDQGQGGLRQFLDQLLAGRRRPANASGPWVSSSPASSEQ